MSATTEASSSSLARPRLPESHVSAELVDLQETLFGLKHNSVNDILTERSSYNEVYTLLYKKEQGVISEADFNAEMDRYRSLDRYGQLKSLLRKADITHQHNLSFSGGSDIYKYAFSANYEENLPYEKEQSTQRIGVNLKNQFDFFKWMRVNVGLLTSNVDRSYDNGFSRTATSIPVLPTACCTTRTAPRRNGTWARASMSWTA